MEGGSFSVGAEDEVASGEDALVSMSSRGAGLEVGDEGVDEPFDRLRANESCQAPRVSLASWAR